MQENKANLSPRWSGTRESLRAIGAKSFPVGGRGVPILPQKTAFFGEPGVRRHNDSCFVFLLKLESSAAAEQLQANSCKNFKTMVRKPGRDGRFVSWLPAAVAERARVPLQPLVVSFGGTLASSATATGSQLVNALGSVCSRQRLGAIMKGKVPIPQRGRSGFDRVS
jgi:hypothetical protein